MVINKKKYKSPVLSLFPRPLRRTIGRSARDTARTGNGFSKNPALFRRKTELIAVTIVLCLAVWRDLDAHFKDWIKAAFPGMREDPDGVRAFKDFNELKFIETTDGDIKPGYAFAQEPGIDVRAGNDASAR
jgi:hypothetical protein